MLVTPRFLSCYPKWYFQVHFLLVVLSIQRNIFKTKANTVRRFKFVLKSTRFLKHKKFWIDHC